MQPVGVAGDGERFVGQVELPAVAGPGDVRVADRVDGHGGQVDRLGGQRAAGVQPGQQQQVVDEAGHPGALRLDPAQRVRHVGRHLLAAPAGHLGVPADGCEGCTQLVAGVGDELAYPRLAGLPGGERGGDVAEHPVERAADLPDLGAGIGVGGRDPHGQGDLAAVQRQFGDPGGGGGDAVERAQRDADDERAEGTGDDQAGADHPGLRDEHPHDRVVHLGQRDRENQDVPVAARRPHRDRPVLAPVTDDDGARAFAGGYAGQRGQVGAGHRLAVAVAGPDPAGGFSGDGHPDRDRARREPARRSRRHLVGVRRGGPLVRARWVHAAAGPAFEVVGPPVAEAELVVDLVDQEVPQRHCGQAADAEADQREQRHHGDHQPAAQRPAGQAAAQPATPVTRRV